MQLFGLGIPCIYYGTEQGLRSGPEPSERPWLGTVTDNGQQVPAFGRIDVLLREAMFGPDHPRASGFAGAQGGSRHRPARLRRSRHRGGARVRSD